MDATFTLGSQPTSPSYSCDIIPLPLASPAIVRVISRDSPWPLRAGWQVGARLSMYRRRPYIPVPPFTYHILSYQNINISISIEDINSRSLPKFSNIIYSYMKIIHLHHNQLLSQHPNLNYTHFKPLPHGMLTYTAIIEHLERTISYLALHPQPRDWELKTEVEHLFSGGKYPFAIVLLRLLYCLSYDHVEGPLDEGLQLILS